MFQIIIIYLFTWTNNKQHCAIYKAGAICLFRGILRTFLANMFMVLPLMTKFNLFITDNPEEKKIFRQIIHVPNVSSVFPLPRFDWIALLKLIGILWKHRQAWKISYALIPNVLFFGEIISWEYAKVMNSEKIMNNLKQ